jgi:phosphoglucosamine mutase
MKLFGSSGIRRVVSRSFLELIFQIGMAVGTTHRSVVIGMDTRTSADAVKYALISGLLSTGCRVCDAGMIPTPTLAYAARRFEAGAMITASHNPPEYNGVKLCNPDGSAFNSDQRKQIEEKIDSNLVETTSWDRIRGLDSYREATDEHMSRILQDFGSMSGTKVILDCGCGAASVITPYLLKRLGCQLVTINSHPSGFFPRSAEPTAESLSHLVGVVRAVGADVGIAHDGDGDRMVAVDEEGKLIPGDKLLVLFTRELGVKKAVTTVDASMAIEELGFEVIRTRVGDAFVSEELKHDGEFGGEPSGSWIFPQVSYCPDGIYAAAQVVQMAKQGRLSQLANDLPSYPILRGSARWANPDMESLEARLMSLEPLSMSRVDGIMLTFNDGWLLIRPSGTEPKTRIAAEAREMKRVRELYDTALTAVQECASERIER